MRTGTGSRCGAGQEPSGLIRLLLQRAPPLAVGRRGNCTPGQLWVVRGRHCSSAGQRLMLHRRFVHRCKSGAACIVDVFV